MKINKLKLLSIAICCLVSALCSEAQCMDNQSDTLELSVVNRATNTKSSSQNEIATLALEDKSSLFSYLLYPAKTAIHSAYEVIKYTAQNSQKSLIIGVYLACQFTAIAADCNCIIYDQLTAGPILPHSLGQFPNETACNDLCAIFPNCKMIGCIS